MAQNTVMSSAELKKLLITSKAQPVACAVGTTADQQGAILLSKMKAPRALEADLKTAANATNTRFGRASVEDGMTVTFFLNRDGPPGLDRKLLVALKGTGYTHVKISVEQSAG